MQLPTNRVNFTTSSVAQFNYARFLTKSQSPQKGITDIVTVLGVHSDSFAALDKTLFQCKIKKITRNRSLVLFVPLKNVEFNIRKPKNWFRIKLTQVRHFSIECDFQTGEMIWISDNNVAQCCDNIIYYCNWSREKKMFKNVCK